MMKKIIALALALIGCASFTEAVVGDVEFVVDGQRFFSADLGPDAANMFGRRRGYNMERNGLNNEHQQYWAMELRAEQLENLDRALTTPEEEELEIVQGDMEHLEERLAIVPNPDRVQARHAPQAEKGLRKWCKDQWKEHPVRSGLIVIGGFAAIGLAVDVAVRGKGSVLGRFFFPKKNKDEEKEQDVENTPVNPVAPEKGEIFDEVILTN